MVKFGVLFEVRTEFLIVFRRASASRAYLISIYISDKNENNKHGDCAKYKVALLFVIDQPSRDALLIGSAVKLSLPIEIGPPFRSWL
jgi:hypothetical protein